mmetsp:Transcript_21833/g.31322  ORF Transcript_21833/g.31322 Transcript_21833/m.31322 type:complete len:322 (+) Transcript_21833:56-1021(+)|eukprot:CAMPEP_0172436716 /NCGR_PEP_ID=MMETSP1064-20121228/71868_1 /TAXON_ID=202472 /ORGANISM="Aulacoseira subarctica , Strain CCAP 1002/5" /LENGTH=321 /DNA_ID=CAMNT_0013185137 /DNA_START=21 /DNA_END=986 /DNA_ORIENTATION=-
MTSRLRRFVEAARMISNDTKSLIYALAEKRITSMPLLRDELVTHAKRDHNSVALSFLNMDRSIGLIRYHGLVPYCKQYILPALFHSNRNSSSLSKDDDGRISAPVSPTRFETVQTQNNNKAKVAFMITSSQKITLIESLGYDISQVKEMKPIEALIALEHKILPGNDETIARLVTENEELLKAENEEKERRMAQETEKSNSTGAIGNDASVSENSDSLNRNNAEASHQGNPGALKGGGNHHNQAGSFFGNDWYEVLKESKTEDGQTSATVIALYPTEEEALLCVAIKEEFAIRTTEEFAARHTNDLEEADTVCYRVRKRTD